MDQGRSKDQRSSCFTDQRIKVHQRSKINKIKDHEDQLEIKYLQITDQKFKGQLFTDQITNLVLVRRKPGLFKGYLINRTHYSHENYVRYFLKKKEGLTIISNKSEHRYTFDEKKLNIDFLIFSPFLYSLRENLSYLEEFSEF